MNIVVKVVKENEDGSANVEFEADNEGKMFLLQEGLIAVLIRAAKEREDDEANS